MDIINFKKDCQPRTDIVKNEKGDIVTVPLYFAQVEEPPLSAMGLMMSGRQKFSRTTGAWAESLSEFDMATEKLKRHK
jgi:hypothetical protein